MALSFCCTNDDDCVWFGGWDTDWIDEEFWLGKEEDTTATGGGVGFKASGLARD